MPNLFKLILQIAVILVTARVVGMLFRKIRQPQVVGEMVAGILLGPSLLGWAAPGISNALFPASSLGHLSALSQVGLVLFMFLVGLSLNPKELQEHGHAAVLISHVSIVTPFCLGSLIALYMYPRLSDDSVTFTGFALFMGAAMSITAFPVLARILTERNLLRSRMGTLSIACAAVDDVTGWCILAYIVVVIRATHGSNPVWVTIGGAALYVLVMLFGVKRLLRWFEKSFQKNRRLTENAIAFMVLLVLASALATESLGIHLLFGAFLMGAIMPKRPDFVQHVLQKFESVTVVVLLPLFFAFSGLRTSIGVVKGPGMWFYALIVIVVAIAGKLGGSAIAARLAGMPWRDAASLGILMNTRGLMELVILNIGLDIGVISSTVFSIMVLMALVTTFMTTPLLELVYPPLAVREAADDIAEEPVLASSAS
ncbi:MAG TPA: cation:proton antiporter [Bryobacteraceae bacterium]|nr:cation:proton antiporter [Bryobacteraceae bacterium]